MARVRYSFTVPDTNTQTLQELERLKKQNKLSKIINEFFELYFLSKDFRNIINDLDCRDEQIRLNKLNEVIKNNTIYEKLGLRRDSNYSTTNQVEQAPIQQQKVINPLENIDLEGMINDAINKALQNINIPTQNQSNNQLNKDSGLKVQDTTIEDNLGAEGEEAGDDFDDFFGDFVM